MATTVNNLPPPCNFDASDNSDIGKRWECWCDDFQTYLEASNVTDERQNKSLLMYLGGSDLKRIYFTLGDSKNIYTEAINNLNEHFLPKTNLTYERYRFNQLRPSTFETIDHYVTRLRESAKRCGFNQVNPTMEEDNRIRDHVLSTWQSPELS